MENFPARLANARRVHVAGGLLWKENKKRRRMRKKKMKQRGRTLKRPRNQQNSRSVILATEKSLFGSFYSETLPSRSKHFSNRSSFSFFGLCCALRRCSFLLAENFRGSGIFFFYIRKSFGEGFGRTGTREKIRKSDKSYKSHKSHKSDKSHKSNSKFWRSFNKTQL